MRLALSVVRRMTEDFMACFLAKIEDCCDYPAAITQPHAVHRYPWPNHTDYNLNIYNNETSVEQTFFID